jgi:trimethylamine--corrinoid protein Co-methyltransferase
MRPRLEVLEASLVERILDEALAVLERIGVLLEEESSIDRVRAAGMRVDPATRRLHFSRDEVEAAIRSAPASFALFDREGREHAILGSDEVHFVPASSALRIRDPRTDELREADSRDFVEYIKVADGLEHLTYLSTAFIPRDVPQDLADGWRLYLALSHTEKPIVSGAFTATGVPRMGELLSLVRGGRDAVVEKPLALFTCCPNTPLRWGEDPLMNLMDCAEWGIPIEVVPVLLLGMISPVTPVGALVLHTAEVLSGLVIAQRVRPGTPVLFGGAPAAFHMRLMTNPMTAVEALRVYCGYAQIARRLGLPSQAYMGLSDSKWHDAQSGAESGIGAFLAGLAGIHSVSGPGMLDYVNCFSLEKLLFDDELVAHVGRFLRPVEVRDDLPTLPLLEELVREKHLLMSEHTLEHWPEELYLPGPSIDRTNWDQWEQAGSRSPRELARERIEELLENWEGKPLDAGFHREARQLFASTATDPGVRLPEIP